MVHKLYSVLIILAVSTIHTDAEKNHGKCYAVKFKVNLYDLWCDGVVLRGVGARGTEEL